jgi:type IV pilus assembly protein PilE
MNLYHLGRPRGFTLMELLFAMAVVAILSAIALPSFADATRKARRLEAVSALLQLQLAQERWRADHARYGGSPAEIGFAVATAGGSYTLAIAEADEAGYVATATAASPQAGDTRCRTLKLVQRGGQTARLSVDATGTEAAGPRNPCWP